MIKYALLCDQNHSFESWFADSAAFDMQAKRGFVSCPVCRSAKVGKAIMAPAVMARRTGAAPEAETATAPEPLLDEGETKMRALARQVRDHVMATSEDVGRRFADDARAMHEGAMAPRAIRGEASLAQVRELVEDGVPVLPVPVLPEERN